jgi:endonuclease YncB( thermonuclease family)
MIRIFPIAFLVVLCLPLLTNAGTLQVKVVAVQDGKTIIVENTGRRARVILKGADAPELDQPSGDIASRHLSNLILGKEAAVEVTGMADPNHFVARVFLEKTDISLQMIRDGVAWYDRSYEGSMSAVERRLYAESEQLARSECRGLWQDPSPTPPWEWRQAKTAKKESQPATTVSVPKRTAVVKRVDSGWPRLSLPNAPFSLRMPGNGRQNSVEVQVPKGQPINLNIYVARHLKIGYVAFWGSGPYHPQAISSIFDRALEDLNQSSASHGLLCEFTKEKDASLNGYIGERYKIHGCYYYGGIRYYYRVEGKTLRVCLVVVMSEVPGDPLINQFLESFTIHK